MRFGGMLDHDDLWVVHLCPESVQNVFESVGGRGDLGEAPSQFYVLLGISRALDLLVGWSDKLRTILFAKCISDGHQRWRPFAVSETLDWVCPIRGFADLHAGIFSAADLDLFHFRSGFILCSSLVVVFMRRKM